MSRGFSKILAIVFVIILIGVAIYFLLDNRSREVKLVDAFSGQPISNTDVRIYSDNGIRCITTPCNTEGQEWLGKSNDQGVILIPSKVINVVTGITATGYKSSRDLSRDAEKLSGNSWLIELDPDSKIDNSERRVKLIDSQTQKPLANTTFWIVNNQSCRPPECKNYIFSGTTNSIGNSYYPISSIARDIDIISWIFVSGYKVAKFPTGWVNYKAILEKETSTFPSSGPTSTTTSSIPVISFCSSIMGGPVFRSVKELEVGLGPDGPVMGHWTLGFKGELVSWHHSDVVESGSYICKSNRITAKFFDRSIQSNYDDKKNVLVWEGEEYVKSEMTNQACPTPQYTSPHCPKIPTKAKNLITGEIKEFTTACLPLCWVEY